MYNNLITPSTDNKYRLGIMCSMCKVYSREKQIYLLIKIKKQSDCLQNILYLFYLSKNMAVISNLTILIALIAEIGVDPRGGKGLAGMHEKLECHHADAR